MTHPADLLRVAPGAVDGQAGQVDLVGRHTGTLREGGRCQAELLDRRPERGGGRRRDDERPRRELHAVDLEPLLGSIDPMVRQAVAQRRHVDGAEVRDGVSGGRRIAARDPADDAGRPDRLDRDVEHPGIVDLVHLGMLHQPERPPGVVISS